jgi:hypothetical protein
LWTRVYRRSRRLWMQLRRLWIRKRETFKGWYCTILR